MKTLTEHPYFKYFCIAVVAGYVLFLQFYHLGELPIVQWDESRLAVNAAEMSQSNNFLISTYENKTDLYNTKPPLLIWLQTLSIKVFGLSEWAIRLPSALAALTCFLVVFYWVYTVSQSIYWGLLASLLLATSGGFIQLHGSMTGDYDTLLSAFVLAAFLYVRSYIIDKKDKALHGFVICQSLAILCKSAAAFIPLPVYLIVALMYKDWSRTKKLIIAIAISLLPFATFIGIRELSEPGYLKAIWNNDFHGRFSKPLEGHTSEWHYYIVNLFDYRFHYWIWLLPVMVALCPFIKDKNWRFLGLSFLLYLFFLSMAGTRIHWYDMPILPLIAMILSDGLYTIHSKISQRLLKSLLIIGILGALIIPIKDKFEFIVFRKGLLLDPGHYELSHRMKAHDKTQKAKYLANWYDAEFYFYTKQHPEISRGQFRQLQTGDTVMYGNLYKDSLPLRYEYHLIDKTDNAQTVVITGHKNP